MTTYYVSEMPDGGRLVQSGGGVNEADGSIADEQLFFGPDDELMGKPAKEVPGGVYQIDDEPAEA